MRNFNAIRNIKFSRNNKTNIFVLLLITVFRNFKSQFVYKSKQVCCSSTQEATM